MGNVCPCLKSGGGGSDEDADVELGGGSRAASKPLLGSQQHDGERTHARDDGLHAASQSHEQLHDEGAAGRPGRHDASVVSARHSSSALQRPDSARSVTLAGHGAAVAHTQQPQAERSAPAQQPAARRRRKLELAEPPPRLLSRGPNAPLAGLTHEAIDDILSEAQE